MAGVLASFNACVLLFFAVVNVSQCTTVYPTPLLLLVLILVLGAGLHTWVARCAFSRLCIWPLQKQVMWTPAVVLAGSYILVLLVEVRGFVSSFLENEWWFCISLIFVLMYPAFSLLATCYIAHKRTGRMEDG